MGTLLQEFGHDIVLLHFIHRVLSVGFHNLFFIVSPATGPKLDIHFANSKRQEYTSAFGLAREDYIPEFLLRTPIARHDMVRLYRQSKYRRMAWYTRLSAALGKDLKVTVEELWDSVINLCDGDAPDIIGVSRSAAVTVVAEVKFEGFGKGTLESTRAHLRLAQKLGVSYFLVLPRRSAYGRGVSDAWIRKNIPPEVRVIKCGIGKDILFPKAGDIEFSEVKR
jgi:hypothetical protein